MKIFLASFLIVMSFLNIQDIDVEALKKDPSLVQYKKLTNELMDGIRSKTYKIPANLSEIQKEIAKNPAKENVIKLYKEGGMDNAEEYLEKINRQAILMIEFMKKHPEIGKLDQKAKIDLMMKLLVD